MFNWKLYGLMVRAARQNAGVWHAADLGEWLEKRTGVYMSRDVVYKIEQGRQEPKVGQFVALNLALFGKAFPAELLEKITNWE